MAHFARPATVARIDLSSPREWRLGFQIVGRPVAGFHLVFASFARRSLLVALDLTDQSGGLDALESMISYPFPTTSPTSGSGSVLASAVFGSRT